MSEGKSLRYRTKYHSPKWGQYLISAVLHSLLRLFWHGGVGRFRILADQQQHPSETLPVPLELPARFGDAENGQM
jgi:hypothetical protein